jgi:hypothetical protein
MRVACRAPIRTSVAVAVVSVLGAGAALAQTVVNCTSVPGALATFFAGSVPVGTTVEVDGNCVGQVNITNTQVTIEQAGGGGTIYGVIFIAGSVVNIENITIDGTGEGEPENGPGVRIQGGSPGGPTSFLSAVSLIGVTVENFHDDGIGLGRGGTIDISGGAVTGNFECGMDLELGASAQVSGTTFSGNGNDPSDTEPGDQCGISVENGAVLTLSDATIESNNGPALWISQGGIVTDQGSALSSPGTVTQPVIVVRRGSFDVSGDTITGTGQSNVIFATPGATITLQGTTVTQSDANDATALIADGSTLLSLGGNTITNSASGGVAVSVSNASTFRERNESAILFPLTADAITGAGSAQIESNIELGTGGSTPSGWTGAITVAQNSSVRMDGGITVTGAVTITQGSNGFFNTADGGQNIVTGGVGCPWTDTAASRVAGNAKVLLSSGGASAVTIGVTSPDCLGF